MAPSNALTVEEIINGFPNPILPKIDHEPTFEDIQVTTRLLNANSISIPSMGGGGAHGHLGIIMTQVEYATISTSPWVEPYNPNAVPIIPPGTTAVDASQIARLHAECRRIYTNRINVDQDLKKLILEAYDNMYTSQLEDYLLQYANRSALEILMHLKQTYGFINPTQLAENYNKMTAPINFQDPIETLFKQI
jgi:formylmethanofuran dehydrogenase subunit A